MSSRAQYEDQVTIYRRSRPRPIAIDVFEDRANDYPPNRLTALSVEAECILSLPVRVHGVEAVSNNGDGREPSAYWDAPHLARPR